MMGAHAFNSSCAVDQIEHNKYVNGSTRACKQQHEQQQ
jgi:hypothetical protein